MKALTEYLLRKQAEIGIQLGRPLRSKEFAKMIGVSPNTYSQWVNGDSVPGYDNIQKIAAVTGDEVFDITGYSRLSRGYKLSDSLVKKLADFTSELSEALKEMPEGSPELSNKVKSIMERFGLVLIEKTKD